MVAAAQTATDGTRIRLLSYNIQVGINTMKAHHYLTHSWRHLVPHRRRFNNLDSIAHQISGYDIVGLQEVDAGSLRSNHVNLTEYLAQKASFPFWHHRINRKLGNIAQHSSGMLFRLRPSEIVVHKLPGLIPGRGVCMARFGNKDNPLVVFNIHLSLSSRARKNQLEYITDLIHDYEHVIIMGDLNTSPDSEEMQSLFRRTRLNPPEEQLNTFPSWQPNLHFDHILVSDRLMIEHVSVLNHSYSDHLPIAMDVMVPDNIHLV
ncbi:MAG: endonuclease/exonuclease/phosphatase family protein [Gammaproteobacteria bacterium]|nr:endonuclease/exonuclease/phosphatase family protein [Gammaproteobacteria bacterium]